MRTWSPEELGRIADVVDLDISPLRDDGVTYRTATRIWIVAVAGRLYVRAYTGPDAAWYRAARRQRAGRIVAGDLTREVAFASVDGAIDDAIDDAYRTKYRGSSYLSPMIGAGARETTLEVIPRPA